MSSGKNGNQRFSVALTVQSQFLMACCLLLSVLLPNESLRAQQPPAGSEKPADSPLAGVRTWTDSTGKFKTDAEFVEFKDGKVTLKTAQGRVVTLPLDRFSQEDQKLVIGTTQPAGADGGAGVADWSQARLLPLTPPKEWKLEPEGAEPLDAPLADAVPLGPPIGGSSTFENVHVLGFDRANAHAILSRVKNDETWIERCDLKSGKSLGSFELPKGVTAFDVDPSGQRLAVRSQHEGIGPRSGRRLDIWDLGGLEPTRVASWEPYAQAQGQDHNKNIAWIGMVDADHVFTMGNNATTLWHIPTRRAIYALPVTRTPTLSTYRRYMAVATNDGMFIVEVMTGKTLAQLEGKPPIPLVFAFRQDAQRLALFSGSRLQVWDCATGQPYREVHFGNTATGLVEWVGEDFVCLSHGDVIDIERQMLLWRYEGNTTIGRTYGGKFWFVTGGGQHGKSLVGFKLPHEEALASVAAIPPEELLVLRPGSKIRLNVRLEFGAEHEADLVKGLTERLQENGFEVAADAAMELEVVAEKVGDQTVTYKEFGLRGRTAKVQVSRNAYMMRIKEGDTVHWQTGGPTDAPPIVMMERGETPQQALDRFNALHPEYFLKRPLPKQLARAGKHNGWYGVSRLSVDGITTTAMP